MITLFTVEENIENAQSVEEDVEIDETTGDEENLGSQPEAGKYFDDLK